jgi:hypothetical protein
VFSSQPRSTPVQIASNAAIVLREIGLEAAIRAVGVKPRSCDYRDLRTGRMLYQAPLGDEAAFLPETQSTMAEVAAWAQRHLRRNDTRPQAAE